MYKLVDVDDMDVEFLLAYHDYVRRYEQHMLDLDIVDFLADEYVLDDGVQRHRFRCCL